MLEVGEANFHNLLSLIIKILKVKWERAITMGKKSSNDKHKKWQKFKNDSMNNEETEFQEANV